MAIHIRPPTVYTAGSRCFQLQTSGIFLCFPTVLCILSLYTAHGFVCHFNVLSVHLSVESPSVSQFLSVFCQCTRGYRYAQYSTSCCQTWHKRDDQRPAGCRGRDMSYVTTVDLAGFLIGFPWHACTYSHTTGMYSVVLAALAV